MVLQEAEPNDTESAMALVACDGAALRNLSEAMKSDKDVVIAAVQQDWRALFHAAQPLKLDREVVIAAVRKSGEALSFVPDALTDDKEIMLLAVQQDGRCLKHASPSLRGDKDVVLTAVRQSGNAYAYASSRLKADKDVFMEVVKRDGLALGFAPPHLKVDMDIVLAAATQNPMALKQALNVEPHILDMLKQLRPKAMEMIYVFKVSLVSGRSCCVVLGGGDGWPYSKRTLLGTSAERLGMKNVEFVQQHGSFVPLSSAVDEQKVLQEADVRMWDVPPSELHELQLVVTIATPSTTDSE